MKKVLTILSIISAVLILTGCDPEIKEVQNDIDKALEHFESLENFTMTAYNQVDNAEYSVFKVTEEYLHIHDTDGYEDYYVRGEESDYRISELNDEFVLLPTDYRPLQEFKQEILNTTESQYVLEDGYFIRTYTKDDTTYHFKLKVENNQLTEVHYSAKTTNHLDEEEILFEGYILFSNIGETTIEVPVVENMEQYIDIYNRLSGTDKSLSMFGFNEIYYEIDDNHFFDCSALSCIIYISDTTIKTYEFDTQTLMIQETLGSPTEMTIDEFLVQVDSNFAKEDFDYILEVIELIYN